MKLKQLIIQLIKFEFVGVIAAAIDVGVLVLFTEVFGADVLISSGISFCVSVIANYLLSMKFVFKSKGQSKLKEFTVFVLLSVGGLCINQFIMWLGTEKYSFYYLAVKLAAMIIVPIYNFITRKVFLEKKQSDGGLAQ